MSNDEIEVGLIGFGTAGRVFHVPLLRAVPGLRLAAILQRTGETASQACPDARTVRTVGELLSIGSLRLVVIATPTATHAELASRCLASGRDVVVDKPFAATAADAAALAGEADRHGLFLGVFHNRRWDGDFLTVRRLLQDHAIGRPVLFESRFDRYRPAPKRGAWKEEAGPGGGILLDIGAHLVDQALTLFGLPDAVTADVRIEREGAVADDAFDIELHYPLLRVRLGATMLAADPGPRFVVRGTDGTYLKRGFDPQEERLRDAPGVWAPAMGEDPPDRWGVLTRTPPAAAAGERVATIAGNYRGYYENVRDVLCGQAVPAVTVRQALDVMRVIDLARESSGQRRTIELPGSPV